MSNISLPACAFINIRVCPIVVSLSSMPRRILHTGPGICSSEPVTWPVPAFGRFRTVSPGNRAKRSDARFRVEANTTPQPEKINTLSATDLLTNNLSIMFVRTTALSVQVGEPTLCNVRTRSSQRVQAVLQRSQTSVYRSLSDTRKVRHCCARCCDSFHATP